MTAVPSSERSTIGWIALLFAFGLLVVSAGVFSTARSDLVSDAERTEDVRAGELLEARRAIEMSSLEVVMLRMLDGVGFEGDRTQRLAVAAADLRAATDDLAEIAAGTGLVAQEAAALLDQIESAVAEPIEGDLDPLFTVAEDDARWSDALDVVVSNRDALHQLSFVSTLPYHVMIEAIAADTSVNARPIAPEAADHLAYVTEVVRNDGGWFGTDPRRPLEGSEWIEVDDAREVLPEVDAQLSDLVEASDLVPYDVWMRELGDSNTLPPFEVLDMLEEADRLQLELVELVDSLIAEDEAARAAALAEQNAGAVTMRNTAFAVAALALVALAVGIGSIQRASRAAVERARLASIDALTSVGNRYALDERTDVLTSDPANHHHLIAMIDLDRFKIVNDVHGHAAGDALLVEIAQRLQSVVDGIERTRPGTVGTVIRLGGDEFLLTLHSPDPIDASFVREQLDAIRTSTIDIDGQSIELQFSLGLVEAERGQELASLMSAADLAVYEDKSSRSVERRSNDGEGLTLTIIESTSQQPSSRTR